MPPKGKNKAEDDDDDAGCKRKRRKTEQVWNEQSGRWVNADGAIGTRIRLKELEAKVSALSETLLPVLLSGKGSGLVGFGGTTSLRCWGWCCCSKERC